MFGEILDKIVVLSNSKQEKRLIAGARLLPFVYYL